MKSLKVFLLLGCSLHFAASKLVVRLRADSQCPMPGYFRDESNCRKFYRCAEHPTGVPGQNFISKSEFDCPPGTIFDEALSSCNHIMFVQNIPPGCDISTPTVTTTPPSPSSSETTPTTTDQPVESSTTSNANPGPSPIMLPSINLPSMPPSGEDLQQPPMINLPNMPGEQQGQPPMFPSIQLPNMPGDQQGQPPMFPSIQFPGGQGQSPMIPGIPSGGHQNLLSSLNFPNLPQLPSTVNIHTVSMLPTSQLQLNSQTINNNNNEVQNMPASNPQNLQNLANAPTATVTLTAAQNNPHAAFNRPLWVRPQQFPQISSVNSMVNEQQREEQQQSSSNNEGGGWIVPDNFPTFLGSPFLLSAHPAANPFIMF